MTSTARAARQRADTVRSREVGEMNVFGKTFQHENSLPNRTTNSYEDEDEDGVFYFGGSFSRSASSSSSTAAGPGLIHFFLAYCVCVKREVMMGVDGWKSWSRSFITGTGIEHQLSGLLFARRLI